MRRRTIGSLIAVAGAIALAVSAYLDWHAGLRPLDMPLQRLVRAETTIEVSSYWKSVAAPLVIGAGIGALGSAFRSRILVGLSLIVGVLSAGMWLAMLVIDGGGFGGGIGGLAGELDAGWWTCTLALITLLLALITMGPVDDEIEERLTVFEHERR